MAGRSLTQAVYAQIEQDGGEDFILDQIRAGSKPRQIMNRYGVDQRMFWFWAHEEDGRWERYQEARRESAHAHADAAETLLEGIDPETGARIEIITNADARMIIARADHKKWLASKLDQATFGDQPQVQINQVSLGELHVAQLQELGSFQRLGEGDPHAGIRSVQPVDTRAVLADVDDAEDGPTQTPATEEVVAQVEPEPAEDSEWGRTLDLLQSA